MCAVSVNIFRKMFGCRRGMAATEFALLLPLQVLLFFGLLEASDAMTVNRRVTQAANALADLVAQSEQVTYDELDSLFIGISNIIEPNGKSNLTINLVSVTPNAKGEPVVHWSRDMNGNEPYAEGAAFTRLNDETILNAGSSLIFVEIYYDYEPTLANRILSSRITFEEQTTRWPRLSTRVQLCESPGKRCTT